MIRLGLIVLGIMLVVAGCERITTPSSIFNGDLFELENLENREEYGGFMIKNAVPLTEESVTILKYKEKQTDTTISDLAVPIISPKMYKQIQEGVKVSPNVYVTFSPGIKDVEGALERYVEENIKESYKGVKDPYVSDLIKDELKKQDIDPEKVLFIINGEMPSERRKDGIIFVVVGIVMALIGLVLLFR